MATKSILKTVRIKGAKAARGLADALEYAQRKSAKQVTLQHKVSDASREEIRSMFANDAICK